MASRSPMAWPPYWISEKSKNWFKSWQGGKDQDRKVISQAYFFPLGKNVGSKKDTQLFLSFYISSEGAVTTSRHWKHCLPTSSKTMHFLCIKIFGSMGCALHYSCSTVPAMSTDKQIHPCFFWSAYLLCNECRGKRGEGIYVRQCTL
jgi:hypothetical protein